MNLEDIIKESVAEHLFLDLDKIKLTDSFKDDYDIDSLDLTEITMDLEVKLNVDISLNYLTENLRTVQDLINLVTRIVDGEVIPISKESGCGRYGNLIKDEND